MNALATAPQAESKDIKLSSKKVADSKSEESSDFFENIIKNIVNESEDSENKSFLLSKLLNLSSDFEKKEEILSKFSDAPLFNENQIGQVTIQDLLKIATNLKKGEDVAEFPTDSKTLKLALLKPEVTEQLKGAKNIKDILDIAKKNNIEVKNFQFFKEEATLNPADKKIVKQLKSEEIFKLIEKQTISQIKADDKTIINSKQTQLQNSDKINILKSVLASEKIVKPVEKEIKTEITKNVKIDNHVESKNVKIDNHTLTTQTLKHGIKQEIKTDKKIEILKSTEDKTKKVDEPTTEKIEKNVDINKTETTKIKPAVNNFQQTLNPQKNSESKILNTSISNETKTEEISEKIEKDKDIQTTEKIEQTTQTKTHTVDKTRTNMDVKKTFSTFAQEFKEKVENYKPPLMKIKMELNPKGLGEVDVTLINRGNNLQVNINSNSSTIAMFVQNQVEFKNSLVNMGFSDLQMNFSEQQKKEQDSHNQKNGKNVFEHFEDEEEQQDGFEMIIPRYV